MIRDNDYRDKPLIKIEGMFHKRERLAEETEGGFGYMAMTQAINQTRGATYAGWKSKAMDSARGNASHELHNAFWNFSHGTNFTVVHQENPLVFAEGNQLCKVCFHSGYLLTLKKTKFVESQTNNMRYAFQLELLADPPEELRHKYSKSTVKLPHTMPESDTQPYSTNRLRQGEKTLLFIHKPTVHEGRLWVHVGIEGEKRLNYKDEVTEPNFRKYTMNGSKGRVLCALCFDEEDMAKLEAKYGQRAREAWKKTVDPRVWSD